MRTYVYGTLFVYMCMCVLLYKYPQTTDALSHYLFKHLVFPQAIGSHPLSYICMHYGSLCVCACACHAIRTCMQACTDATSYIIILVMVGIDLDCGNDKNRLSNLICGDSQSPASALGVNSS